MQVQVVPELLHLQLHKLRPLQQVAVETLTGVTEARTRLLLGGATAAVVLLTVHTHMLRETGAEKTVLTTRSYTKSSDQSSWRVQMQDHLGAPWNS